MYVLQQRPVSSLLSAILGTNAHVFWLVSRAAGTVALLTASASVVVPTESASAANASPG